MLLVPVCDSDLWMLHYRRGYWSVRNLRSARQFPATASYSWSVKIIRHADYCAFWSSVHVVLHGVTLELLERDGTKRPLALFHFLMLAHPHVLTGFWVPGRQLWLHASCSSTKGFCQATRRDTAFPPGMPLSSIVIHCHPFIHCSFKAESRRPAGFWHSWYWRCLAESQPKL